MIRYYAAAFLFCMLGMVAAIAFGRPLSALLFSLGASCFVLRAMWATRLRKPGPAAVIHTGFDSTSGWTVEMGNARRKMANALNQPLNLSEYGPMLILPPGVHIASNYPQLRKREAFRRYREHWTGVGQ